MIRVPAVLRPGFVAIALAGLLAACSGSHEAAPPATTTTTNSSAPATTTEPRPTTSSTGRPAGTTTTPPPGTTVAGPGPRITGVTSSPPSPVACNAPTMIQLSWTATGATSVALSIDGKLFAAYGGGPQDHLEYLACDGKTHTYLLTAFGNGRSTSVAERVTSRPVA